MSRRWPFFIRTSKFEIQMKRAGSLLPFLNCCRGDLRLLDVRGLQALGALDQVELDGGAFRQRAEARARDGGVVDEHVFALLGGDETKSLGVVEPLHVSSRSHCGES